MLMQLAKILKEDLIVLVKQDMKEMELFVKV